MAILCWNLVCIHLFWALLSQSISLLGFCYTRVYQKECFLIKLHICIGRLYQNFNKTTIRKNYTIFIARSCLRLAFTSIFLFSNILILNITFLLMFIIIIFNKTPLSNFPIYVYNTLYKKIHFDYPQNKI